MTYTTRPLSYALNGTSSVTINGGNVTIKLGTPKDEYMWDLTEEMPSTVTAVPSNTKHFNIYEFYSSDGEYVLVYAKDDMNMAILVYADKNVTITGTETWVNNYDGKTYTQKWNCALKAGWNYVFWSNNEATRTETYTTGATPSGYKWQVFPNDD
jgi:hypothetical protein